MPPQLWTLIGAVLIVVGIWGLVAVKNTASSRGLQPNYYHKKDSPFPDYCFLSIYLFVGTIIVYNTL